MTIDVQKFSSIGGEVAPAYYGRVDLDKYDLSLALAENFFIDYRGGFVSAAGMEYCEPIQHDTFATKFFPFKFSVSIANTNVLLFGKNYIRFLQDGSYVLEGTKPLVSMTNAALGVMTVTGHGYATGDLVKIVSQGNTPELLNRLFVLGNVTANTFELYDLHGNAVSTSAFTPYTTGAQVARVYTVVSPYATTDLVKLRAEQVRDTMRLTCSGYPIYNLTRFGSANWTVSVENISSTLTRPSSLVSTALGVGSYNTAYVVTQINAKGVESLPSDHSFLVLSSDTLGATLTWTPITGAVKYRIYRSRIALGATATRSSQTGYVGESLGAYFLDESFITPDFSKTPPTANNPFLPGQINFINITASGAGYTNNSVITATDPNPSAAGFIGYVIVNSTGGVAGVIVVDPGHDYTVPVFSVTIGAGAVLAADVGPSTGTYPSISATYQQRQIYGATDNAPLTVYGSRPGKFSSFTTSTVLLANDSFEHEIDSKDLSPLNHLVPSRGGLIAMSPSGVWLMSGSNGGSITATDVQADLQVFEGANELEPIKIATDIYYCSNAGGFPHKLGYNAYVTRYSAVDISILANHLIPAGKRIVAWDYANNPHKMIWAVRNDGLLLNITVLSDQEVFAWARRVTQGSFNDVVVIEEETISSAYLKTTRVIAGQKQCFIERVKSREFSHVEESFCVDCGLKLDAVYPAAELTVTSATGSAVSAKASASIFVVGDVGKVIRSGGGKMNVTAYVSPTEVTVNIIRPITDLTHRLKTPIVAQSGEWTLDTPVTTIGGFSHLAGHPFVGLADGNVVSGTVSAKGVITLLQAATRFVGGLAYTCTAKNLPLNVSNTVIDNKRQRIVGLSARVVDSVGLKAGTELTHLYEVKERRNELYGEPTELSNGMINIVLDPLWTDDAAVYIVQDQPLPVQILGYVLDTEIGDDNG